MPTRDPAWPNHKVHPEERWGRVFLRSDKTVRTTEKKKKSWGKVLMGRGREEGDHGRSDRQTDSLADSAGYTFLVLTIPSC